MTIAVANTEITNTFDYWRNRTNELADAMSNYVVTTDSNTTTGNASITGKFTANIVSVGNATVNVVANSSAVQVGPNVVINTSSVSIGNTSVNVTANSSTLTIGSSKVVDGVISIGNSTVNVVSKDRKSTRLNSSHT